MNGALAEYKWHYEPTRQWPSTRLYGLCDAYKHVPDGKGTALCMFTCPNVHTFLFGWSSG
jgi:hypothetical protein